MEPDATLPNEAADAAAPAPPSPEESAPADSGVPSPEESAFMNAIIRGATADVLAGASKPGDADADDFEAEASDGASAADGQQPDAGVKPPDTLPKTRRGAAAEIARLQAERDALEARVAELSPKPAGSSEAARQQAIESEARYRQLLAKPDDDPDWSQDDYVWLQDEKRKRALFPEVRQHYETVVEHEVAAIRSDLERERADFWAHVKNDMASAQELPGVDLQAVKDATTFAQRDRVIYAAARARSDAELKAKDEQIADLKRQLLGGLKAPMAGGRSSPGRTYDENSFMNNLMRGAAV